MKIVQGDELTPQRGLEHRGGTFHYTRLMHGEPATLGNFQLNIGMIGGDFYSPRHRHNFEQIRYQLEGTLDFARTGKMTQGMLGYFPEGVAYGPQTQREGESVKTLVLQCGGASGSGYLSREEVKAGMEELKKYGTFKDGVFHRNEGQPGKRNLDGYQAIWEFVNQRPMVYPKPRYASPILLDPANYEWVSVAGQAGVAEKLLGVFTERRTEARFLKLDGGARLQASGRGIYVVLQGAGTVEGQKLRRFTTIYPDAGEAATVAASETTQILHMGLPDLAGMQMGRAGVTAQAAE